MAKTFLQVKTDFATVTNDSNFDPTQFLNMAIQYVHSKFDWNFNKSSVTFDSVAQQQYYPAPYNMRSASFVNIYANNNYYVPQEIRQGSLWRRINYNAASSGGACVVYSDIPAYWFVSNRTKQIGIYPTPANSSNPITVGYTKTTKVFGAAAYTTGTVTTVANSSTITGAASAWDKSMIGSYIKITSADTVLNGLWFEISDVSAAGTLKIQGAMPIAVAGKNYTINELVPFLDGYEDIALYMAAENYYDLREMENIAAKYRQRWEQMMAEMKLRDQRSESDLMKKQFNIPMIDPNKAPDSIFVRTP